VIRLMRPTIDNCIFLFPESEDDIGYDFEFRVRVTKLQGNLSKFRVTYASSWNLCRFPQSQQRSSRIQ